jgi:hypothetical protein
MRNHVSSLALALALASGLATSPAAAQVVVQGQVTVQTQPTYGQPVTGQPVYGQPVYGQPTYADPQGGNAYTTSAYVQQPVGQPQPVRYVHRSAAIPALFVPGIILLAGGYLSQAVGAPIVALDHSGLSSDWLGYAYVPLLGPWLQMGTYSDVGVWMDRGPGHFSWVTGLAQGLGLVLLVVGLTVREEWDEPVYALTDAPDGPTFAFDATPLEGGGLASATLRF